MLTDSDPNLTNSLRKSNKKRRFGKHINSPTIYVPIVVCTHINIMIELPNLHLNLICLWGRFTTKQSVFGAKKVSHKSAINNIYKKMLNL